MSNRKAALDVLKTRLEGITVSEGFNSDAGQTLLIGQRPVLGPSDSASAIALLPQQDIVGSQMQNVFTTLPVLVEVIVPVTDSDPWGTLENIISDIKTAVETDHDLDGTVAKPRGLVRGPTTPHDREAGSLFVGATVEYRLEVVEGWGAP